MLMCSSSYGCSLLLYVSSVISTVLLRCCFADEAIWSYHRFSMLARDGVLGSSDFSFLVGASCFDWSSQPHLHAAGFNLVEKNNHETAEEEENTAEEEKGLAPEEFLGEKSEYAGL
ncbi:unnamed protein product [Brassica oleracea]